MHSENGFIYFADHIAALAYLVLVVCGLTGLIVRSTRRICGLALSVASAAILLDIWFWSIAAVHSCWGTVGVIIGLLLGGVGVVPMALSVALLHHYWILFGYLVTNLLILFVCKFAANTMLESARALSKSLLKKC